MAEIPRVNLAGEFAEESGQFEERDIEERGGKVYGSADELEGRELRGLAVANLTGSGDELENPVHSGGVADFPEVSGSTRDIEGG